MLNGLDLFSGIGGNSLALGDYINTLAYCEQDRYAQHVLLSRMSEGLLLPRPIWDDVTTLKGGMLPHADIIVGGFPCQDISVAGNGAGLAGKRSGLFYEIIRLTKEINPSFVFLENVPAIRTRGLREVIRAFTDIGYDCRWTCVSAAEVGAPHLRKRWFLLAKSRSRRCDRTSEGEIQLAGRTQIIGPSTISNASRERLSRQRKESSRISPQESSVSHDSWWTVEPNVGRVANGVPSRVDRIRCLGNAVVPAQAREAFKKLIGINERSIHGQEKREEEKEKLLSGRFVS